MSLPDFQTAFARLIASPQLCEKVLVNEDDFFEGYTLTTREKARLHSVLRQKGMSACCSLYRLNRITPLYTQLSNTATLLMDDFVPLAEEYWQLYPDFTLQFKDEVLAFSHFLRQKIAEGSITTPYLKEVLQLEIAINELSYVPEGECKVLPFDYDIFQILHALNNGNLRDGTIEKSPTLAKIYLQNQKLQMDIL